MGSLVALKIKVRRVVCHGSDLAIGSHVRWEDYGGQRVLLWFEGEYTNG